LSWDNRNEDNKDNDVYGRRDKDRDIKINLFLR
jgi:hypothetical protein